MKNKFLQPIFQSFLHGVLLTIPPILTFYILSNIITRLDRVVKVQTPGLGLLIILIVVTLIGYIGSNFLFKSTVHTLESWIARIPLVNLLYSSFKEFMFAFVGEKKFTKPVLITRSHNPLLQQIGFITQNDLKKINLPGKIAVHVPLAYSFAGDLYIMDKDQVTPLNISNTEIMKFIVSGGVAMPKDSYLEDEKFVEDFPPT